MIKHLAVAAGVLGLCSIQTAWSSEELANKSGCLACHGVDAKVVGPGLKEIAAKYKGVDGAAADLVMKVKNGGTGNWGQIPMPPNAHISDADIQALVDWILTL